MLTEKKCWVCGREYNLHRHHIFYGIKNRGNSERYNLCCYLCQEHHEGTYGVHGMYGHELDMELKKYAQQDFEINHSRKEFIEIFGRNYL